MDIRIRRIIMSIFFLVFFILAPLLILYASGYRYDFKRGKVIRTGNIFVEAKDIRFATVYLNNEPYKELLSKKLFLKNLLPDDYKLRIEKEGTFGWESNVRVVPAFTTFVNDLILFVDAEAKLIDVGDIERILLSSDKSSLIYTIRADSLLDIYTYSIDSGKSSLVYRSSETENVDISWSPNSHNILLRSPITTAVISTRTPHTITTLPNIPKSTKSVTWDSNDDTILFASTEHSIYEINISSQKNTKIISTENTFNGSVYGKVNALYLIESVGGNSLLQLYTARNSQPLTVASLPNSTYLFLDSTEDYITIKDTRLNKIYLIRKPSNLDTPYQFLDQVVHFDADQAIFSPNKSTLLIYNEFELSTVDVNSKQVTFINRFSKPINNVQWYSDSAHLLLALDNKIIVSDLQRLVDEPQKITLQEVQTISDLTLVNKNYIYFGGSIDELSGLYSLQIK